MKIFLLFFFIILLKDDQSVVGDKSSPEKNLYNFLTPSLFPQIGPVFRFRLANEPSNKIPNPLKNELLWRKTIRSYEVPITHSLIRHAGFGIQKNFSAPFIASYDLHKSSNSKEDKANHVFKNEYEKVNHIPNVLELDDKILLSNNLNNMVKKFGAKNFPFIIPTYAIPNETQKFFEAFKNIDEKLWVQKPSNSSNSRGMNFFRNLEKFNPNFTSVVQKYIENPILVEKRKAEVRRYVLITGFDPIKIYTIGDELVKVSHRKFSTSLKTLNDTCIHTPYYLQCKVDRRFKRKTAYSIRDPVIQKNFKAQKLDWVNITRKIDDAIIKIFFSVEKSIREASYATLKNRYNAFNILGFDFFVDTNSNVFHNEINRRPGVHNTYTHNKIGDILADMFNIAGFHLPPNLSESGKENISKALDLKIDPSFNEKIYSFNLTGTEIEKHEYFETNFKLTDVDSYAAKILENLTNDDMRVLMVAENEISRMSKSARRLFPLPKMSDYTKYLGTENCYYYMLFSAWENVYGNEKDRRNGINKLREVSSGKNFYLKN